MEKQIDASFMIKKFICIKFYYYTPCPCPGKSTSLIELLVRFLQDFNERVLFSRTPLYDGVKIIEEY